MIPLIPCWRKTVSMSAKLLLFHGFPGQVWLSLHVMDRIHFGVLVGLVEFDAAGHAGEILGRRKSVTDGLRVFAAAAHHVCDQHDLVEGMSVEVGRIGVVFGLECLDKFFDDVALVCRVELNYAYIADRRLAGLLLESERQPNRAELDGLAAAALDDAGLR